METTYQRIGREQRERQEARAAREAERNKPRRRRRRTYLDARIADQIDGYDRDDLGLSHGAVLIRTLGAGN